MERISIFNYEAFYLDFLEGNLNEEDTALLMAFLEANPDLKLDDDILPTFDAKDITLDAESKNDLKQPAMGEAITADNAEYFMIADAEGLLDDSKTEELDAFVATDEKLKKDKALYGAVYFEPDMAVAYGEKDGLKRKIVFMWQYVSIAAAASIIAFFLVWSSMNNDQATDQPGNYVAEDTQDGVGSGSDDENNEVNENTYVPEENGFDDNATQLANQTDGYNGSNSRGNVNEKPFTPETAYDERPNHVHVDRIERRPVGHVLIADNRNLEPITNRAYPPTHTDVAYTEPQASNDMASFNKMENPIEPITKFVMEKTNTDVDFRRTKKNKDGKRGFFIKIGKFEISRKRH